MARRPIPLPANDGRQRWCNDGQTDWNPERRRQLKRLIQSGLFYREIAKLMGVSKNSICSAAVRYDLTLDAQQVRDRARAAAHEGRGGHPRKHVNSSWEARLTETWAERKARLARERTDAR